MERVAIYKDKRAESDFLTGLEQTRERANELLEIFNFFQQWRRIDSYEGFINLIADPVGYFDEAMGENVNMSAWGKTKPDMDRIAEMFGVSREGYVKIIQGSRADLRGFDKKLTVNNLGKPVITLSRFEQYADFLIWTGKYFRINEAKVAEHTKTFLKYAETPEQAEAYRYWVNLMDTLNAHAKRGLAGGKTFMDACYSFGLRCVDGVAYLDDEKVYYDVINTTKQ